MLESALLFVLFFGWVAAGFAAWMTISGGWPFDRVDLAVPTHVPLHVDPRVVTVSVDGAPAHLRDVEARLVLEEPSAGLIRAAAGLLVLFLAGLLVLLHALLRIVRSLRDGDPFIGANVVRLRAMACALIGMDLVERVGHGASSRWLLEDVVVEGGRLAGGGDVAGDVTPWFAAGLLLLLAHVFRRGVELRRESSLTV